MTQNQDNHVEEAYSAMAVALTRLIAAVREQTTASAIHNAKTCRPWKDRLSLSRPLTLMNSALRNTHSSPADVSTCTLAGSRGCGVLAKTYGARIMAALGLHKEPFVIKVGTTTGDPAERLRQIGQDGYGAAVRTKNGA